MKMIIESMADSDLRVQKHPSNLTGLKRKAAGTRPGFSARLFITLYAALMWAVVPQAWANPNTPPTFAGVSTNLSVYHDAGATDFKSLVYVNDPDDGQALTWSSISAPAHGTVLVSSATSFSGGSGIPPGGTMTYTPTAGYTGPDSFVIQVSDGIATATRTISVTMDNTTGTNGSVAPLPVDNTQPTTAMTWVIARQGIFPSRSDDTAYADVYYAELRLVSFNSGILNSSAWLPCDGRLLPINQNQALFSLLSTTYGGDGRVTFGLPDLRGRVPVGMGQGVGLTAREWGDKGGRESFTLSTANLPSHRHSVLTGNTGLAGGGVSVDNMEPWAAINFCIATNSDTDDSLGWVRAFAFNFAPSGFHAADGTILSIQDNPTLFTKVGTAFGGDGVTTFALPDLRGRTPIGTGGTHVVGEQGGSEQIVLSVSEMPAHTHTYSGGVTGATGGGLPHDTMQPFLALNVDISFNGVYGQIVNDQPAVGEVRFSANNNWVSGGGWAACDGSLQPIAEQEALFNLIGTTFGGDGQETFAMPNLRDGATAAVGAGPGLTSRVLGQAWGSTTQPVSLAQLPAHTHVFNSDSVDISLSKNSVQQSAGGNAVVGSLSTTDADAGDTHSYTLVDGAGAANNSLFTISGSNLIAVNAAAMPSGNYSVRLQTDDGNGSTFQKAFTVTVADDVVPAAPTVFSAVATGANVALSWINPSDADWVSVTVRRSASTFPVSVTDGTLVGQGLTGTSRADNGLADGTYYYSIFARDGSGNYSVAAQASVLIDATPPAITSVLAASGAYGSAFTYAITANDSPVTFGAAGLPGGLTVNTNTGTISGTATEAGLFNVVLGATDIHGNVGNATLIVDIAKANAAVNLGNLSQAYDGTGRSVSATTTPDGLAVSATYNGLSAAPTNAGSYTVVGIITDANYTGAVTNTLIITPMRATVVLSGLSQIYDGTGKSALVATTPSDLAVNLTYNGLADAPTNVGSYTVIGIIADANYVGATTNTLVITPLGAAVVLNDLSQTYDGTGKSASAVTAPSGLVVNLTYNSLTNAPTNADSYVVVGTINEVNYQGSITDTLTIAKSPLTVTADDKTRAYGETNPVFTGTITGAAIGDDLTASYATTATPVSPSGGNYSIVPSLIDPAGRAGNYTVTTNNGTLTITMLPFVLHLEAYSTNQAPVDPCHPFPLDQCRVSATGEVERTYTILVSTNLTDWSTLTNVTTDTNGMLEFIDQELPQHKARYFRGMMQ